MIGQRVGIVRERRDGHVFVVQGVIRDEFPSVGERESVYVVGDCNGVPRAAWYAVGPDALKGSHYVRQTVTYSVTLGKAADRPHPNGVRYQPSEFELDRRRHNPAVDRYERQGDDLANNCPDALRSFFADAAVTGLVCTLRNLPESEWSY